MVGKTSPKLLCGKPIKWMKWAALTIYDAYWLSQSASTIENSIWQYKIKLKWSLLDESTKVEVKLSLYSY